MKHVVSLIIVLSSFFSYSQVAIATTPDATVCVGQCALFSSATSVAGSSPIINSIWSIVNNGTTYNGSTSPGGVPFTICNLTSGTCSGSLINQHANGTSSFTQFTDLVTIVANPIADITATVTSCNVPLGVQYGIGTSTPASTFAWTFESGNPATFSGATPPIITYTTPNSYDVTLLVTETATGCTATATTVMQVSDFITDFTAPLTACEDVAVQLTDNSTVGANDFTWTITPNVGTTGSANPSSLTGPTANPSVVFDAPGTYTITLLSKNTNAPCTGTTVTQQITILAAPVPSFTTSVSAGCSPLPVQFNNTSLPSPGATFAWNFGHPASGAANTSTATSPSHIYTVNNSTFTPTLTMTATNGCSTTFTIAAPITLAPLEAHFTTDIRDGCQGAVAFNDISIIPPGTSVTNLDWDFGDGGISNVASPIHNYLCGEYNVRLIVTVTGGCKDTVFLDDNKFNTPIFSFGALGYSTLGDTLVTAPLIRDTVLRFGTLPAPFFTLDHNNDCIKKAFEIVDVTQIACPHGPGDVTRQWFINNIPESTDSIFIKIFGDTMQNPGAPFNLKPGIDIALEINFRGCIDSLQTHDSIYISAPVSRFALSQTLFCDLSFNANPLTKQVTIDDDASIYGHQWDNNNTPQNPTILDSTVANQAFDDVKLTYKWGDGSANIVEEGEIFLDDNPTIGGNNGANIDPTNITGLPATTVDAVTGQITHTFNSYGTFDVWQIIENRNSLGVPTGCIDSSVVTVNISWVETDFVFDIPGNDSLCLSTPFTMTTNTSTHGLPTIQTTPHTPLNYSFNMVDPSGNQIAGSGSTTNQTFANTISVAGTYNTTVTTTNSVGCSNTFSNSLTVFALPSASFTISDPVGCIFVPFPSDATNTSTHPALSFGDSGSDNINWAPTNAFQWSLNGVDVATTSNISDVFPNTVTANTTYGLVVTDGFGCVSPIAQQSASVQQPTAGILNPSNVCSSDVSGQSIQFGGNGNIVTWEWRLDGVVVPINGPIIPFPTGPLPLPDWTIPSGGPTSVAHTIGLIVTDSEGCKDSLGITGVPNVVNIISPQANFTESFFSTSGNVNGIYNCPPVVVDFTDLSQSFSTITNYAWICETILTSPNATTSQLKDPKGIQYLFPGSYDVTLLIQDSNGCTDSIKKLLVVQISGPSAKDSITFLQTTCGQSFEFEVMNQTNVDSWYWEMGDGNTVTNLDFPSDKFTYVYGGTDTTYNPTLHVVDALGCDVPYDSLIVVPDNGVTAFFVADPITDINLGTNITFDPTGSNSLGSNLVDWQWNYGDGSVDSTDVQSNITHFYTIGDTVLVTLTVTDATGCKDDYTFPLVIGVKFDFPNVLTGLGSNGPNADYQLFADVMKSFEITIVNRWGNVVHEGTLDPARPRYLWDGVDDKSGKLCNEGTYFYLFKGILKNDVEVDIHGFCTLIGTTDK